MVEGRFKSKRAFRKVFVKTPGNRTAVHYRRKKPNIPKCAICGEKLMGVLRELPYKMHKTAKTKKRPERKFGGTYCSKCSRKMIIKHVRESGQ